MNSKNFIVQNLTVNNYLNFKLHKWIPLQLITIYFRKSKGNEQEKIKSSLFSLKKSDTIAIKKGIKIAIDSLMSSIVLNKWERKKNKRND